MINKRKHESVIELNENKQGTVQNQVMQQTLNASIVKLDQVKNVHIIHVDYI